jgi:hypothetical protein
MVGDAIGVTVSMDRDHGGGVFFVPWHAVQSAKIDPASHDDLAPARDPLDVPVNLNSASARPATFVKKGGKGR